MAQNRAWTIVVGAGPLTGASVARRFAEKYNVAVLSRRETSYKPTVDGINARHGDGRAVGIKCDVSDAESLRRAFGELRATAGEDFDLAAAIFNGAGGFVRKPFLEISDEEFAQGAGPNGTGAFLFSKAVLPLLLAGKGNEHPPTLIFTGATASLRGSALFAVLASSKFVIRAISQSLAREFGPQGVHVAHVIVDGPIAEEAKSVQRGIPVEAMIDPDEIAASYWYLHTQPRTCFTYELDVRNAVEKW